MTHIHTVSGKTLMQGGVPPTSLDPRTGGKVFQIWETLNNKDIEVHYTHINAGEHTGAHSHPDCSHYLIIISGIAHVWIDHKILRLEAGDFLEIPRFTIHDFSADPTTDVWDLSVTNPGWAVTNMDYDVETKERIWEELKGVHGFKAKQ
jgi:mannose-6-phosphate isomerase-like protein (cupin superfamily)